MLVLQVQFYQLKIKEEYENLFEEDEAPEEINAAAINSWLFNRDTIKKLIELLMEKGIKVEGGDKLGKTIIFAKNHRHAQKKHYFLFQKIYIYFYRHHF